MRHADLVAHCLAKPGAWLDEPWEGDLVAKVADKIFAFLGSPAPDGTAGGVGLKCGRDAEAAREWRERYPGEVDVAAYIGRYGWNTFTVGGSVPDEEVLEAVDASYDDVVSRLPRSRRPVSGGEGPGSTAQA
jgi:predicted DNA-binding protein (MmcQ/YjbR family)